MVGAGLRLLAAARTFRSTVITIDHLFYFILWLTGVVFVVTEVVLFWFLWRYDGRDNARSGQIHATAATPGSGLDDPARRHAAVHRHLPDERLGRLEDSQPAADRAASRSKSRAGSSSGGCAIPARTASSARPTTFIVVNDLHLPVNEEILLDLKSMDVLHSFFLPNLRVKQDAVPGMRDSGLVPGHGNRQLRPGLRRVVRLGALQNEGPADGRIADRSTAGSNEKSAEQQATQDTQPARGERRTIHEHHRRRSHASRSPRAFGHGHHCQFLSTYVFSKDHKVIGIQFLFSTLLWFLSAGCWPWAFAGKWPGPGRHAGHRQACCSRPREARSRPSSTPCCSRCTPR